MTASFPGSASKKDGKANVEREQGKGQPGEAEEGGSANVEKEQDKGEKRGAVWINLKMRGLPMPGLQRLKDKEEKYCPREGVPSSGSSIFTLRNSQTGISSPPSKPHTIRPGPPTFPSPPLFTPPFLPPHQTPPYCTTANWGFCGGCHCWGPVLAIWVAQ